jgi:hypothetical protein
MFWQISLVLLLLIAVSIGTSQPAAGVQGKQRVSPYTSAEDVHDAVLRFQRTDPGVWEAEDMRCNGGGQKKVVSMSLYGTGPNVQNFADGAVANSLVLARQYEGWVLRVYTSSGAAIAARLRSSGVEVIEMPEPEGIYGMFWRFFVASDPCVSVAVFRDTDSLINPREHAAVDEWLASGKSLHSMIDAPEHASWPMQGGMWGIRGGVIKGMEQRALAWGLWRNKLDDMHFLKHCIWPLFTQDHLLHVGNDAVSPWGGIPFPPHARWIGHVGQQAFVGPHTNVYIPLLICPRTDGPHTTIYISSYCRICSSLPPILPHTSDGPGLSDITQRFCYASAQRACLSVHGRKHLRYLASNV